MLPSIRTVFRALPPTLMRTRTYFATAVTLAMGLAPLSGFAAEATIKTTDLPEDEIAEILESSSVMNSTMMDRGGGGGLYYPGPYGGITVDANVTKEVTPDFVAMNGYCEVIGLESRDAVRAELARMYSAIKETVGSDGRVRRSGPPSVYPFYDGLGGVDGTKISGSLNVFIRVLRIEAAQRIADILDRYNCNPSWDVRLMNPEDHEMSVLDELLIRANKRKALYEKLLSKKLTKVIGVSLSTWADGWSTYDPETNKADATTTLTLTFDAGTDTRLMEPPVSPARSR